MQLLQLQLLGCQEGKQRGERLLGGLGSAVGSVGTPFVPSSLAGPFCKPSRFNLSTCCSYVHLVPWRFAPIVLLKVCSFRTQLSHCDFSSSFTATKTSSSNILAITAHNRPLDHDATGEKLTQQRSIRRWRRHFPVLLDSIVAVQQHAGPGEGPSIEARGLALVRLRLSD